MASNKKTDQKENHHGQSRLAHWVHIVIFEADTKAGRVFDLSLMWAILASLIVVMLDSIKAIHEKVEIILYTAEWFFTILFTIEYLLRVYSVKRPLKYIFSFFGIVDLLSLIPTYLSIFIVGSQYLMVIRTVRLLRIFRIFKLARHLNEARVLYAALRTARHKIVVFLLVILSMVTIMGAVMYQVEGAENGFTSIPRSMYWAIVTMTTVGYGDIAPKTVLGQFISSIVMILGYAIIAIPTGIVSAELSTIKRDEINTRTCANCSLEGHDTNAEYCKFCGEQLDAK
ncbi:MAG: ion transporter [Leptospirales bacterium]